MSTPRECFDRERAYIERVAGKVVRRYRDRIELREALTVALGGLWRTAIRHHALPPDQFRTLAARRAAGSIIDHYRESDWRGRTGYQAVPHAIRYEYNSRRDPYEPTDVVEAAELSALFRRAVARLSESERSVVQSRYLSDSPVVGAALAQRMGITEGRVSQLASAAVARLRRELAGS